MATPTPITTLELRTTEIPRSPLIEFMEQQAGRSFTHEHRHFLAGEPVHCGDILQRFEDGNWVTGRYEWTCQPEDRPTFHVDETAIFLTPQCLLRWPE